MPNPSLPQRNAIWVHSALDDLGLKSAEFRVYAHLARRAGRGVAWPSITSIAHVCRLSRRTVMGALFSLRQRGLVQIQRGGPGYSNRYQLVQISRWPQDGALGAPCAERSQRSEQCETDTTQGKIATTQSKRDTTPGTNGTLQLDPVNKSKEVAPINDCSEDALKLRDSMHKGPEERQRPSLDSRSFWMLMKQLECNAELIKTLERRSEINENDKLVFRNPADREEHRRLKSERKALLERTRPA